MLTAKNIIVVEDSAPGRDILATFIEKIGYRALQAADGQVAIELIRDRNNVRGQEIAAVLADLRMPRMDGIELLKQIRAGDQWPEVKDVPFVFITATSDQNTILEAKSLKINGYILKPVTFERIQKKLNEIFNNASEE